MPDNTFILGHGSKIDVGRIASNSAVTFTELYGVGDITLPNSTRDEVETTHQGSNMQREFIAGLIDNGEVSFEMNWVPNSTSDKLLTTLKGTGENVQLRFRIGPTATANTFALTETYVAFVKGYERTAPVSDKASATVTFRVSGLIV